MFCIAPYTPYSVTGYVGFTVSFMYTVGSAFLPETPVFYILKGKGALFHEPFCILFFILKFTLSLALWTVATVTNLS